MELDLNIDSNGNVIVNTLSEYVAYISQLQAANEGSNERFFFDLLVKTGAETPQKQENATL